MVSLSLSLSIPLFSVLGWSYIPDFATKRILAFSHRSFYSSRNRPAPLPGTRQYAQHYAATFALVVLAYLSYNLVQSIRSMQPNFYQILNVPHTVDEAGLKVAFRQFAKKYHPDRPGVGKEGEQLFIMIRDVYDALKDPVVRFAYDRFGPEVLSWQNCSTVREYLHQGLLRSSGYHIVVGAALVFWSLIGSSSPVSFWRYIIYLSLFTAELALILSPSVVNSSSATNTFLAPTYSTWTFLNVILPSYITHQHILFLHNLFIFVSIALSRVVPVLLGAFSPAHTQSTLSENDQRVVLERLLAASAIADREASIVLHTLLHSILSPQKGHEDISSLARPKPLYTSPPALPFVTPSPQPQPIQGEQVQPTEDEAKTLAILADEMEKLVIETNIKKEDGPLRTTWEGALARSKGHQLGQKEKVNFWEAGVGAEEEAEKDKPVISSTTPFTSPLKHFVARSSPMRARSVSC